MSNRSDITYVEEMGEYYEGMPADWPMMPATPYVGCYSPDFAETLAEPGMLMPLGVLESSFHPGPEFGYHSQGYYADEHQHIINDPLSATVGLGISAPFPDNFPRSLAPSPDMYAPDPSGVQHGVAEAPSQSPQGSPQGSPAKRARHQSSDTSSSEQPSNAPINIAPNPEGVRRMEQDRQDIQPSSHILRKPRAPGRGRRDPRAEYEDAFVEDLRDKKKAWKVVRLEFEEKFQKEASESRLQMRLHRRYRERKVRWANSDIELLLDAHRNWANDKFQYLSDKMKELGGTRWYSADQCRNQLRLLEAKEQHDRASESPSVMSEPAPVTPAPVAPAPTVSRKRRRASDS
ncbi:uncharacterized protein N7518_001002 [Penicillium psychrosexuale]|uniref:uncharacterized protein n=1 Tax=Penicillium psychrosexuale TaxID=1002107 RepID=UPI002544EE39|nr:uncharacterized protein N7518_001002 [Penicillium psychrosexuale]KAJ5804699.1 hypothetical protein N7518_001002 [Penicillium psychrosexuale]